MRNLGTLKNTGSETRDRTREERRALILSVEYAQCSVAEDIVHMVAVDGCREQGHCGRHAYGGQRNFGSPKTKVVQITLYWSKQTTNFSGDLAKNLTIAGCHFCAREPSTEVELTT